MIDIRHMEYYDFANFCIDVCAQNVKLPSYCYFRNNLEIKEKYWKDKYTEQNFIDIYDAMKQRYGEDFMETNVNPFITNDNMKDCMISFIMHYFSAEQILKRRSFMSCTINLRYKVKTGNYRYYDVIIDDDGIWFCDVNKTRCTNYESIDEMVENESIDRRFKVI